MEARRDETPPRLDAQHDSAPRHRRETPNTSHAPYDVDMLNEDKNADVPLERMLRRSEELHETLLGLSRQRRVRRFASP